MSKKSLGLTNRKLTYTIRNNMSLILKTKLVYIPLKKKYRRKYGKRSTETKKKIYKYW